MSERAWVLGGGGFRGSGKDIDFETARLTIPTLEQKPHTSFVSRLSCGCNTRTKSQLLREGGVATNQRPIPKLLHPQCM